MHTCERKQLTDTQLEAAVTAARDEGWVRALVVCWTELGVDMADPTPFNPTTVAIPTEQWTAIGEAIVEHDRTNPLAAANHLLDWMNLGPSSYDPESETR